MKNETYRGIADRLDTDFNFDAGDGPARSIINLLQKKGAAPPPQFYALADGYIGLAKTLESNSRFYLLSLTLFAIALYFFGQSLAMGTGLLELSLKSW